MANRIIIGLPQDWTEYMCELLLNRLIDQELPVEAIAKLEFAKVEVCPECGGTELSGHQARCSRG